MTKMHLMTMPTLKLQHRNCTELSGVSYTLGAIPLVLERPGEVPLAGARASGWGHGWHDGGAVAALVRVGERRSRGHRVYLLQVRQMVEGGLPFGELGHTDEEV